ncbi:MAG: hypothetical protein K0S44_1589 [Bacteroidetes bacterium]|jgi:hypothetical protein|nr:hypothetical protein [Bacteroidota bacterium]
MFHEEELNTYHLPCCLVQILSCKKEEEMPAYTITGNLRENCGSPPLSGAYLELFQDGSSLGTSKSQNVNTTTDNNGHFSFTYKNSSSLPLLLRYGTASSSRRILIGIPAEKNIDLGDIYVNNKVTIILKLNTSTVYSTADTLYYAIGEIVGYKTLPAPLTNGIIDTFYKRKGFTLGDNSYNVPVEQTAIYWGIGYSDFYNSAISWNTSNPYHKIPFSVNGNCKIDTAYLNIP